MAHAANLRELTSKLVSTIRTDETTNRHATEEAFKRLKDTTHSRVNPFEIEIQLTGLVEKFDVVNREDLSASLQSCLDQLSLKSGWTPEVLALLLELSDLPAEKVPTDSPAEYAPKQPSVLTWNDILAQEPLNEVGVWDDVERGYHSSGDDRTEVDDLESEHTSSTQATSIADDDPAANARSFLVQPNFVGLDRLEQVRSLQEGMPTSKKPASATEIALMRESFDDLLGLSSAGSHSDVPEDDRKTIPRLCSASSQSVHDLTSQIGNVAASIRVLRKWIGDAEQLAYIQAMQSAAQAELQSFDRTITTIISRFLQPSTHVVVSLLDVKAEIDNAARRLLALVRLISKRRPGQTFQMLQALYDATCDAQLCADEPAFDVLGAVFLTGLNAYLVPIARWMTHGSLANGEDFFIQTRDEHCEVGRLWRDRFAVRNSDNGVLSAPAFLHPFITDIFATGKSRHLLDRITPHFSSSGGQSDTTQLMTMTEVKHRLAVEPLLPFPELFHRSVQAWVSSTGSRCVEQLNVAISQDEGLWRAMEAINTVFFGSDGVQFSDFAHTVSTGMSGTSGDNFMLTKLAQATFGTTRTVEASRIVIHEQSDSHGSSQIGNLSRLELHYDLPWLLQNIVQGETLVLHSRIFSLLLQCHYARESLNSAFVGAQYERATSKVNLSTKIRHRLLWFSSTWFAHVAATASFIHVQLLEKLRTASGIDGMASAWTAYEQRLELVLLLSSRCKPVHNAVLGLLELCEQFGGIRQQNEVRDSRETTRRSDEDDEATLSKLLDNFERSMSFVQAGVRNISRAAGEPSLEALSLALNWRNEA